MFQIEELSSKLRPEDSSVQSASLLPAFLQSISSLDREFVLHDDGWRGWHYSYRDIGNLAEHVLVRLEKQGIKPGDHILIWSESHPGRVPETTLDELGLTSLARVELILEMEDKLDIELDDDSLSSVKTVAELMQPQTIAKQELAQPRYNRSWAACYGISCYQRYFCR